MEKSTKWSRAALASALVVAAVLAVGCGGQERAGSSASAGSSQDAVAASAAVPGSGPLAGGTGQVIADQVAAVSNDSLPPDVDASIADPMVTPGTIVEVRAKGSPDVEEVLLSDGRGKPQRFVHDPASDLWRASYRVPVSITGERLELAVTAKNDIGRWRRVWVFGVVEREAAKDSTSATVEEK